MTDESPAEPKSPRYRRDIQGMRGVAVALVVLFHAGVGTSGGFVGVDVFFVVSGFVIGRLLLDELTSTGSIALGRFYARRVRRLLPAFAVFSLGALALTVVALSPFGGQQLAARTSRAASTFVANIFLYRDLGGGYFGPDATTNAFLHTWSLSVEEQFYLVLPGVILLAWRFGLRGRRPAAVTMFALAAMSIGSFALSWASSAGLGEAALENPARFAFYASPSRAWEFGVGVMLAIGIGRIRLGRRTATVGGLLACASLAVVACVYDDFTPFPGAAALVPVGAALLLLATGVTDTPVRRALESPPLVWIGDRSYGFYLWHWPMIVVAGLLFPYAGLARPLAAVLSLVPTEISYRLVEQPIRRSDRVRGRRAVVVAAICILVPVVASSGVLVASNRHWGVDRPSDWTEPSVGAPCRVNRVAHWDAGRCRWDRGEGAPVALLVGDSQALSLADGFVAATSELHITAEVLWRAACPVVGIPGIGEPGCRAYQRDLLDRLAAAPPDIVVVANRSSAYVHDGYRKWTSQGESAALRQWGRSFDALLDRLDGLGTSTVAAAVIPEMPLELDEHLSVLRPTPATPTISPAQLDDRRGDVLRVEADGLDHHSTVVRFDPADTLCTPICRSTDHAHVLYLDSNHLTPYASRLLTAPLGDVLRSALADSR